MKALKLTLLFVALVIAVAFVSRTAPNVQAQDGQMVIQAAPVPATAYMRPDYNYTEPLTSCTSCHFSRGVGGDHMPRAVGLVYDDEKKLWGPTGNGWLGAKHATPNYGSTQNTYCTKCHSPMQAKAEATASSFEFIPDGKVEGVTCAVCHPSHNAAVILGRRLGIYQIGKDRTTAEGYKVVHEGEEDLLCLNCHVERHGEGNPAMDMMVQGAGVRCIDCHMAELGPMPANPAIQERAHDWKVAKNLPYSCGAENSNIACHPSHSAAATRELIPYLKGQHDKWSGLLPEKQVRKLKNPKAYLKFWMELEQKYVAKAAATAGQQ